MKLALLLFLALFATGTNAQESPKIRTADGELAHHNHRPASTAG